MPAVALHRDHPAPAPVRSGPRSEASRPAAAGWQQEAARRAGERSPCEILTEELTNAELLAELAHTRRYLGAHEKGTARTYDYGNLLRRLLAEQRARAEAGHGWLLEPGLEAVPEHVYELKPGAGGMEMVRADPETVAGVPVTSQSVVLTAAQLGGFVSAEDIPVLPAGPGPGAGTPEAAEPTPAAGSPATMGQFARPPLPLPEGATGIIWEGSHVTDFAVINGRIVGQGFRAPLYRHILSEGERWLAEKTTGKRYGYLGRLSPTGILNAGRPGSFAQDAWFFPYFGESRAVYAPDPTGVRAQQLLEMMRTAEDAYRGLHYRFSTPPEVRWKGDFRWDGSPTFCPPGGQNCINVPREIHEFALGGGDRPRLVVEQGGRTLSPVEGWEGRHAANAKSMKEFIKQSPESFAARGNVKVDIGRTMQARAGMPVLAGAGMALLGEAAAPGKDKHYLRAASVGGAGAAATTAAETYAFRPLAYSGLTKAGVTSGTRLSAARGLGGFGAAVFLQPVITASTMALSDEKYTTIDYSAKIGRETAAAAGGALAAGLAGMLITAPTGPGMVVGFLAGVGGYLLTDWIVGEALEGTIRESMGELGCTAGIGPGR